MSTKRILLVAALVGATAFAGVAVAQGYGQGQGQGRGHGPWWANGEMTKGDHQGPMGKGHGRRYAEGQGQGHGQGWRQGQGQGQGHGQGQGQGFGRSGEERPFMARFQAIDENSDKVITAAEAATNVENVFAAMDQDNSGTITMEEYMAVRLGPQRGQEEGRQGGRQAEMQAAKAARYAPMDTDGDGLVSKAEFTTAATARFAATDTNKDGSVTPEEFQGHKH